MAPEIGHEEVFPSPLHEKYLPDIADGGILAQIDAFGGNFIVFVVEESVDIEESPLGIEDEIILADRGKLHFPYDVTHCELLLE